MAVHSRNTMNRLLGLLSYPITIDQLLYKIDMDKKTLNSYIQRLKYNKEVICFGKDNGSNRYISKSMFDKVISVIVIDEDMTIEEYNNQFEIINNELIENGRI